jgi:hypothetical protein
VAQGVGPEFKPQYHKKKKKKEGSPLQMDGNGEDLNLVGRTDQNNYWEADYGGAHL